MIGPDGPAETGRNLAQERAVLLTLAAVQFTSIVDFMVIMPLGPQLMRTMGISPAQFGLVVSSYTLSAGVAGVVASSLVDRFGRKSAFLTLYVGFLVGTLLCGLAPTYSTLLAARLVTGAFGGVLGGLAMTIIGDVFPDERRGRATGFLMSAFSLASIVGVPFGLYLGNLLGWHAPFLMLVALGLPILGVGAWALPPLRGHLGRQVEVDDTWARLRETYTHPNHLRCFALIVSVMFGTFLVVPFLSPYFVSNVGVAEADLPWIYVAGGALSLVSSPLVGRWADRSGKLKVYRVIAPASAAIMLLLTNLPRVPLAVAVGLVGLLMMSNAGRMVAAMAMVNNSVEPRLRGGFMSAYSSVQHVASGLGSFVAGLILVKSADGTLARFGLVGLIGAGSTLFSLWLAGRLRPASSGKLNPEGTGSLAELIDVVPAAEAF